MLDRELYISIPGHPAPKGSLKCIGGPTGQGGRAVHRLVEDNARTKVWRSNVAAWVEKKWGHRAEKNQPLGAEVTFSLPRSANHYGSGKNATKLKAAAPPYPVSHTSGDVDKLLRLVLDALQDTTVLPDDCAVVQTTATKTYAGGPYLNDDGLHYPGVVIRLYPIQEDQ